MTALTSTTSSSSSHKGEEGAPRWLEAHRCQAIYNLPLGMCSDRCTLPRIYPGIPTPKIDAEDSLRDLSHLLLDTKNLWVQDKDEFQVRNSPSLPAGEEQRLINSFSALELTMGVGVGKPLETAEGSSGLTTLPTKAASNVFREHQKSLYVETFLVGQWLRLCAPKAAGPGSIPGQGTRSHMLQLRVRMPQLKISSAAATKIEDPVCRTHTWRSQK